MSNLTLVIDDSVLRRSRIRALQEDTSVNAEVRAFLEAYANGDGDDGRRLAMARLIDMAKAVTAGGGLSDRTWTRDDLHER